MILQVFSEIIETNCIIPTMNNYKSRYSALYQTIRLLTLILTLATGTATAAEQQQTIPIQFWGKWDFDLESCSYLVSEGRLLIDADRIEFYESAGPVKKIVTYGNFDLELSIELSGEGETWISDKSFRLSDDQKSLTDITTGNSGFVRYRCP